MVSDYVQVITKKDGHPGVRWVSDGCGTFEVSDADNLDFERGTRIILKLLPESREFSQDSIVDKTIKKFSQFIAYPIKVNGEVINQLGAIWYREKREVTVDEYERFFENLANTKIPYKYHLHYSSDVPLAIKALIYFPSTHNERKGIPMQEDLNLHLYSRKVLIKEKCQELIPSYLRFVKGVVDCEDLPLNISRENYQDSNLITKLRNVLTRCIIKAIDDEAKRDKEKYLKWYEDFGQFFKEGIMQDEENRESLFKLLRMHTVNNGKSNRVSLDDYVAKMKEGQEKIYFITDQSYDKALQSPYMEPLKNQTEIDVLVLSDPFDEVIFMQHPEFNGKKFQSIASAYEEIQKDLGSKAEEDVRAKSKIPDEEVSAFCLWLKNELKADINKVHFSKRLVTNPALVTNAIPPQMRMMYTMMQQSGQDVPAGVNLNDNTMEVNSSHPLIVNLNKLRKQNANKASLVAKSICESSMLQSNIVPSNQEDSLKRQQEFLNHYMEMLLEKEPVQATRKEINLGDEPVLKQAQKHTEGADKQKVVFEKEV